jgi:ATP-dependent Clp protease protease subunit
MATRPKRLERTRRRKAARVEARQAAASAPALAGDTSPAFSLVRLADDPTAAELLIYGTIGGDMYDDGITARDLKQQLDALGDVATIRVRINSPGGSAFDGVAIYNLLVAHAALVTVTIDGAAISAASLVAMAGDEIEIGHNALLMIHRAATVQFGTAEDMRSTADLLDKLDGTIVATYAARTGLEVDEVAELLKAETWFNADEAVEQGFADRVVEAKQVAAHIDLERLTDPPAFVVAAAAAAPWQRPGPPAAPALDAACDRHLNEPIAARPLAGNDQANAVDPEDQHTPPESEEPMTEPIRALFILSGMPADLDDDQATAWLEDNPELVLTDKLREVLGLAAPPATPADPPPAPDLAAAENIRCTTIRALCDQAGKPELARDFMADRSVTVDQARDALFAAMCNANPPVGDGEGNDAPPTAGTPDERFAAEYAEQPEVHAMTGVTVEQYVRSRKIDEGLVALAPASLHNR